MAYYLTIKKRNEYKLLDISSLDEFQRLSNLKSSYSLQEIDLFTSKFFGEIDLKTKLFEQGIISLEDITREISIRKKHKEELEKVMYDPVYSYNCKYLDEIYLRGKLLSLQNDKEFLNKLLNHYNKKYNQEFLREIRERLKYLIENDKKMYNALDSFFKDEIYDIDYKTGLAKLKYKSLHDLAMFVEHYLSEKGKSLIEIEINKSNKKRELEELKTSLTPKENKEEKAVYVRTKKKYDLDGQSSLF